MGSSSNPYIINTADELYDISNKQSSCFKLNADINLENYICGDNLLAGWENFNFTGIFDGNNHKISNIDKALFYTISDNAKIINLTINANINLLENYTTYGALCVNLHNKSTIDNCIVN